MKNKYIIAVLVIGIICWIFASLFRITHAPGAMLMTRIAWGIIIVSLCAYVINVLVRKK